MEVMGLYPFYACSLFTSFQVQRAYRADRFPLASSFSNEAMVVKKKKGSGSNYFWTCHIKCGLSPIFLLY
jgi:hypothetical protein